MDGEVGGWRLVLSSSSRDWGRGGGYGCLREL